MTSALVTQAAAYVIAEASPQAKVTNAHAEVIYQPGPHHAKVTQVTMQLLATRNPNFETIAMVLPDVFPNDISYNSVGSTRFATDVIVVDSGDDQRVQRWSQPLMEYDVAYGVRTMEQLLQLIAFFRAMRGRFYSFCYQDNVDYTSSIPVAYEARAAPPITFLDQILGVGDGNTYVFQLVKNYNSTTQSQQRIITRPQPGTVVVAVNGVRATNWSVDVTTGLVTFTPPVSVTLAHSVSKDAQGTTSAGRTVITGSAGDFTPFANFVGYRVVMSGWATSGNNVSLSQNVATIEAVATDGSSITLTVATGYCQTADTATTLVLQVHPAPLNGLTITAGYLFYVPVRFDTDILPVTIEDYGVGGSNSVKLIEVRSSDS